MSEMSVKAREAAKRKVERLTTDPHQRVDASDWRPPEPLNADVQTGMRPVSPRQYKRGGKVHGEHEKRRADRKPRKSGGRALVEDYMNRDMKEANQERNGTKHVGGMKRGGRTHRDMGGNAGDMVPTSRMAFQGGPSQMSRSMGLKKGGRTKRADGGGLNPLGILGGLIPMALQAAAGNNKNNGSPVTPSVPPVGGAKRGGRAERSRGGLSTDGEIQGTRPTGGRLAKAAGGKIGNPSGTKGAKKSGTSSSTDVRSPTSTSTKAHTSDNVTVTGGAGDGDTTVHIYPSKSGASKSSVPADKREGRKHGGKTGKGKMSVNIVIAPGGGQPQGGAPMAGPPMPPPHPIVPPQMPMGGPPPMPPPGGLPPMMPPGAGMPPGGPPPMMRKHGGSVTDKLAAISAGAGGGLARLVKSKAASKSW